jgi:hypothetical protein
MCLQAGDGSAHILEVEGPYMLTLCMCFYVLDTPRITTGVNSAYVKERQQIEGLSELKNFMAEVQTSEKFRSVCVTDLDAFGTLL